MIFQGIKNNASICIHIIVHYEHGIFMVSTLITLIKHTVNQCEGANNIIVNSWQTKIVTEYK